MVPKSLALALWFCSCLMVGTIAAQDDSADCLKYEMKDIDGKPVDLSKYRGKVVLIVNVASECGLTPQYAGLQALKAELADQGFVVAGFPCNQFGGQEPGTPSQIKEFCSTRYDVDFDLFDKVEVNGENASPLYKQLTALETKPVVPGPIRWNFEKFVVARSGKVVARFAPTTPPTDAQLRQVIDRELAVAAP